MNPFTSLIGHRQAVELLEQAVCQDKVAPAYLFVGPSGVGRKIAARAFSTLLLAQGQPDAQLPNLEKRLLAGNYPDFLWVQPTYLNRGKRVTAAEAAAAGIERKTPPKIRIEQIRDITEFLSRPPLEASRSVVAIEDAATMTEVAANALLKTLEEPGRATLILMAPSTDSLLPTLVSRCQRISFSPLAPAEVAQILRQQGYAEILENPTLLAIAQGSPGQAIFAWKQLQSIPAELLQNLSQPPRSPLRALELAKEVDKILEAPTQLWLLDYLQHCYWQDFLAGKRRNSPLPQLEKARHCLLAYVQPRLVWEVALLSLNQAA